MTLGEAVARKVVSSETMGYFLGRTYLFLTRCGIKPAKLRLVLGCAHWMLSRIIT